VRASPRSAAILMVMSPPAHNLARRAGKAAALAASLTMLVPMLEQLGGPDVSAIAPVEEGI